MKNFKCKDITISYSPSLDGGGKNFGQQYIKVVKDRFDKVGHIFEFCAGCGFIGFSLLANKLCDKLTLADINPLAFEACENTIKNNNLSGVNLFLSDCLNNIPKTERWDLVVGNPPHFSKEWTCKDNMLRFDPDFVLHRRFYRDVRKFLKPNGSVLLQENGWASNKKDFEGMIKDGGLKIVDVFKAQFYCPPIYFIWCK